MPNFSRDDFEILDSQTCYEGFHEIRRYRLRHRRHDGGWSDEVQREVSVRGSAAAAVVYDPALDTVCMVEQFRVATAAGEELPWSTEIVAGLIDKEGEAAEEVIRRELLEEAGIEALYLENITRYWVSPGGSAAQMHLYVALCDLSEAGGIYGLDEEHEDILAMVVPLDSAYQGAVDAGNGNAATLIGLQWLLLNRKRMYDTWVSLKSMERN